MRPSGTNSSQRPGAGAFAAGAEPEQLVSGRLIEAEPKTFGGIRRCSVCHRLRKLALASAKRWVAHATCAAMNEVRAASAFARPSWFTRDSRRSNAPRSPTNWAVSCSCSTMISAIPGCSGWRQNRLQHCRRALSRLRRRCCRPSPAQCRRQIRRCDHVAQPKRP